MSKQSKVSFKPKLRKYFLEITKNFKFQVLKIAIFEIFASRVPLADWEIESCNQCLSNAKFTEIA